MIFIVLIIILKSMVFCTFPQHLKGWRLKSSIGNQRLHHIQYPIQRPFVHSKEGVLLKFPPEFLSLCPHKLHLILDFPYLRTSTVDYFLLTLSEYWVFHISDLIYLNSLYYLILQFFLQVYIADKFYLSLQHKCNFPRKNFASSFLRTLTNLLKNNLRTFCASAYLWQTDELEWSEISDNGSLYADLSHKINIKMFQIHWD